MVSLMLFIASISLSCPSDQIGRVWGDVMEPILLWTGLAFPGLFGLLFLSSILFTTFIFAFFRRVDTSWID